jgi:hypothetical protein
VTAAETTDDSGGGDGQDGGTATATMTDDGTTTAAGGGETPTDAGGTATSTSTSTPQGTPSDGGPNADAHGASLQEAGSYTLRLDLTTVGTTSRGGTVTDVSTQRLTGTQKTIVGTGERYGEWSVSGGSSNIEYYVPPDSDTAFQHFGERTREISTDQALLLNFTRITQPGSQTGNQLVTNFSAYGEAGTGSTPLGPATKYVIDETGDLPESALSQYGEVRSVDMALWVDKDTGIIAKFQYEYTVVVGGEEVTIDGLIAIEEVGSTTVEEPDWVPE